MALNSSGTISLAGTTAGQSIALELGQSATGTISLNDTNVRSLAGVTTPSSTISLSNFYGKSLGVDPGGAVNPALVTYAAGLYLRAKSAYHNENANFFNFGSITNIGGNYNDINFTIATFVLSYDWRGYFFAPATGTYRFQLTSDDGSYLWLGSNVNGNTGQAIVNNGGLHGAVTVTSPSQYSLTGGFFYPIRLLYGNNAVTGTITLRFSVNGGAFTNNGTGYYYYNTLTNGY